MSEKLLARQPSEFKLNSDQDFASWLAQFTNFATVMKIEAKSQFAAICSYLDKSAFAIVQDLNVPAASKENPELFSPLLVKALRSDAEKLPPRLVLKYRTQKPDESLSEYALELAKLATRAGMKDAIREETLIDCFCTGVLDNELSIKLLENTFTTLSEAKCSPHVEWPKSF